MNVKQLIINKALRKYNNDKLHIQTSESWLHSDLYLNTDYIVSDTTLVEWVIKVFSKELKKRKIEPNWIITYPPFGLAIAYALAKEVWAKFGYVNRENNVCNFDVKNGDSVIIVGDDIYSGGSLKETINIVSKMNAKVESPIFTIGNFSGTKKLLGLDVFSILTEKGNLYPEDSCPICKSGSKAILPRPNWWKLITNNKI